MSDLAQIIIGKNHSWKGGKRIIKQQQLQQKQQPRKPLPSKDPGFFWFCRWAAYPYYRGLYKWQKECDQYLNDAKYQMIIVHRDGGKSIYLGNKCQHKMQYLDYDILYLGWTDRRKEVAQNICNFFEINDLLQEKRSEYHFTTKNNGKFDCYLITSKDTLGMHSFGKQERFDNLSPEEIKEFTDKFEASDVPDGILTSDILKLYMAERNQNRKLLIVIDDAIDDSFMKERFKEEDLERRFMSTLFNINPDQWIFTGTRKFEDDFYDFVKKTFKGRLREFNRGPYLREGEMRYNADLTHNPMNITTPERFTHPDMPNYKKDMDAGKRDLNEIYEALVNSNKLYWWFAEYWNDPHPITGEVWKEIKEELLLNDPLSRNYDLCIISLDRATTTKSTSDYTGCTVQLRELKTGNRILIEDYSGHVVFDQLLIQLNDFITTFRAKYEHITIVLVVEKQGGGDDFVTMAKNLPEFIRDDGTRVRNRIAEIAIIVEIHNTGEKISRIKERLTPGIKNGKIRYLRSMRNSETVRELLNFPHGAKVDAVDALANAEYIMMTEYPALMDGYNRAEELMIAIQQGLDNRPQKEVPLNSLDFLHKRKEPRRFLFDEV